VRSPAAGDVEAASERVRAALAEISARVPGERRCSSEKYAGGSPEKGLSSFTGAMSSEAVL
jgi:hypothetical protein